MCDCEGVLQVELDGKHASSADFCRLFAKERASLYKLAFLLTASHKDAEQCLLSALEEAFGAPGVHRLWALSWSKRAVIKQAIRMTTLESIRDNSERDGWEDEEYESPAGTVIDAVTHLVPLERFVFVLSVLERISFRECSVLLSCTPQNVCDAQVRALRQLPTFANGMMANSNIPVAVSTIDRIA